MKDHKYSAWASNDSGATIDVNLSMSEPSRSMRAWEDAARRQLGSGWTVHIIRHNFEHDTDGYFASEEVKTFRIRPASAAAATLGAQGGKSTSDAKSAAARENGKRGGRPRTTA